MRVIFSAIALCFRSVAFSPPQTPVQKQVLAHALSEAIPASTKAEEQVLELFDSPLTRKYLKQFDDGSGLFNISATILVEKFWQAISIAEIVHSFGDLNPHAANCGFDMNIDVGEQTNFFYNQWQLQALKYIPVDPVNNPYPEGSETKFFGFPPFKNVSDPDLKTATDRIVYGAMNMYRGSGGNPQCGPISAVFRRSYIVDADILVAPFDTGFFTGSCNGSTTLYHNMGNETVGVCDAWGNYELGAPPYLSHMLLPYLTYWNESSRKVGPEYINLNLARLITRLLSRHTYSLPSSSSSSASSSPSGLALNYVENTLGYFEFNLAVGVDLPNGIKMMVGMFELLWGTIQGAQLRAWCISEGWPLVWAYNPLMSFTRCGPDGKFPGCVIPPSITDGIDSANVRLLDPVVLQQIPAGHNITVPSGVIDSFQTMWAKTNATITPRPQLESLWNTLETTFSDWLVEPLFPGACLEDCAAVFLKTQACVC